MPEPQQVLTANAGYVGYCLGMQPVVFDEASEP
jgi:hypothetical protein